MSKRSSSKPTIGGLLVILAVIAIAILFPNLTGKNVATPTVQVATKVVKVTSTPLPPTIPPSAGPTVPADQTQSQPGGLPNWLKVDFTNPNPPDNVSNGIDKTVVDAVNQAQKAIDVTSFDLNLPSFVNALVAASQRGVQVRVVYDGANGSQKLEAARAGGKEFDAIALMKKAKIGLVDGGRSSGLMHDKIIIIDGKVLFMGSWNMSYNDTFRNNNNRLEITAPEIIANYQGKFNELFVDKRFGTHATVGAQTPQMNVDGIQVENYFSPPDKVMDKIIAYVNAAQKSIRFIAFTYTDKDLAAAMVSRFNAGVDVAGVIENRGASQGALVPLVCGKVPAKVDGNKYTMHHKVIVIDGSIVITGSFNFTLSADNENDDNIIVIHDPAVAKLYLDEFDRVNSLAQAPDPAEIKCK
jgi:phosphatidylserine/phosphatidylglycerophosphate/cardiolipin synthase-like enzyme